MPYLLPKYTDTTVTFLSNGESPQVEGRLAGGFAGELQSGKVDNHKSKELMRSMVWRRCRGTHAAIYRKDRCGNDLILRQD